MSSGNNIVRTDSYSKATLNKNNLNIEICEERINNANNANNADNDNNDNNNHNNNDDNEEKLNPLQKQCKTFINVVERLYSFAFLVAFLSLCIVMLISRYN